MAGGSDLDQTGGFRKNSIEVINLQETGGGRCVPVGDLPESVKMLGYNAALIQSVNKEPITVLCGGLQVYHCYFLNIKTRQWTKIEEPMPRRHIFPEILVFDNDKALWITGSAAQGTSKGTKDTQVLTYKHELGQEEVTPASFTFQSGPDLPTASEHHCFIKLNSSTILMIGGAKTPNSPESIATYFMEFPTVGGASVKSAHGPDLNKGRRFHVCGALIREEGNQEQMVVIVVGGYEINNAREHEKTPIQNSTEFLAMDSSSKDWTFGPDMPKGIYGAAGVTTSDRKSLLFVGGYDGQNVHDSILKLTLFKDNDWQWTKLDQELRIPRRLHTALLVPLNFC